jgi:hypothetical protein
MATVTATGRSARSRPRSGGRTAVARSLIAVAGAAAAAWVAGVGAPEDARSAVDAARERIERGADPAGPPMQALARDVLRRDATVPAALELAAVGAEEAGDRAAAARLYRLSSRISRRSLPTRLWLAEDAVARGDVVQALANMDIALRTSSAGPEIVFPALARGLEDPALVPRIAAMADRPSEWREAFLNYASEQAEPAAGAVLFMAIHDRRYVIANELDRRLIARVVDGGDFLLARRLDRAFAAHAGADALVADARFANPGARYPFGWGLTDSAELGAARDAAALSYRANSAEGGQIAAQLLTLPEGQYVLESRGSGSEAATPPLWVVTCAGKPRMIATAELNARTRFRVPEQCAAQWLTLAVQRALVPQSGRIEAVRIMPANR